MGLLTALLPVRLVVVIMWLGYAALSVVLTLFATRLYKDLQGPKRHARAVACITLVPVLGWVVVCLIQHRAVVLLRSHGIKTELFGTDQRVRQSLIMPICMHCGYDLTGTTGALCPECGTPHNGPNKTGSTPPSRPAHPGPLDPAPNDA